MKRQVVYLMSGEAHLPYLICSLWTLRRHWQGPVIVYAWKESFPYVFLTAVDKRLDIIDRETVPEYRGKNAQFLAKIRLMQTFEKDTLNLYLDADTTIHGPIDPIFDAAERTGFAATQFCDWKSTGGIIKNRVSRLREFPEIDQALVEDVLRRPWPSVNGGVFACRPDSSVLPLWEKWTVAAISVFIADEAVLHTMVPKFYPIGDLAVLLGGKYNCSPMRFQPKGLADDDVVVRHFHGDSNVRRNKCKKGYDLWWPIYRECLERNIGNMQKWIGEVAPKNKYLKNHHWKL